MRNIILDIHIARPVHGIEGAEHTFCELDLPMERPADAYNSDIHVLPAYRLDDDDALADVQSQVKSGRWRVCPTCLTAAIQFTLDAGHNLHHYPRG